MKDQTLRRIYACFVAICGVIVFATIAAIRNINQASATADWVNHTHAVIYELDRIVGSVVTGDGAARTFLGTHDPRELAVVRGEFAELADHLTVAGALTRDDAPVLAEFHALGDLVEKHTTAIETLVSAPSTQSRTEWEALLKSDPGGETLREIKRRAAKLRAGQFALLDERDRAAYRHAQTTRWVVGIAVALDFLLLAAGTWLIRDDIAKRRRLAETLQAANTTLEARVQERTGELVAANTRLAAENRARQWAAQALEHQLRYNEIVASASSDLVFVVTKSLAITRINPAVSRQTGWTDEDILGRPLLEFVRDENASPAGSASIDLALRVGRELHDQAGQLRNRQGVLIPVRFTMLPVRDNDKVVGGVVLLRLPLPA